VASGPAEAMRSRYTRCSSVLQSWPEFLLLWSTQMSLSDILGIRADDGVPTVDEPSEGPHKVVVPRPATAPPAAE
jgi:hypothetical protein